MKIVAISDTHTFHNVITVPSGDMLIHAGDFTIAGELAEVTTFNKWLGTLPHKYKVIIAGNHDWLFQRQPSLARSLITNAIYLEDSMVEIEGLKIYGSPHQPAFMNWAFNLERGRPLKEKWDLMPDDVDILITHTPPHSILDKTPDGQEVGCKELYNAVGRIRPRLHVFGHIHHSYGSLDLLCPPQNGRKGSSVTLINASICDEAYRPINKPIVVDIPTTLARGCA